MTTTVQAPSALCLANITKRFGSVLANDDVSFDLNQGEVLALLGENGAGKTTLMNILFGQYTADTGSVSVFGETLPPGKPGAALRAGVGMVHQHFTLAANLSVWENIALGTQGIGSLVLRSGQVRAKIRDLSARFHLDVDPDVRVSTLSVGEQQRVEILKALYRDARVLILDEPTAVLTPQEAQDLFATLRQAVEMGLSIIFISHKLHEVMALADRIAVLRHGRLVATRTRAETNPDELVSLMVGTAVERHEYTPRAVGAPRLCLRNISTPSTGTRFGLNNVSLTLHAGQIVGLAGVSGNGQAALSDVISGLIAPSSGDIDIAGQGITEWSPRIALSHGIGRIPEDRHKTGTIADFDLTENAVLETYRDQFSRRGWIDWRGARAHAETLRETYDVRTSGVDNRIRLLSGGNMQKLILGRVLEQSPQIILANQPVRGLDIGAVTYVHRRLVEAAENGAAVLLISEDLDEVRKLSDVVHVISDGRLSPPIPRDDATPAVLGHWMAGNGFEAEVPHAS